MSSIVLSRNEVLTLYKCSSIVQGAYLYHVFVLFKVRTPLLNRSSVKINQNVFLGKIMNVDDLGSWISSIYEVDTVSRIQLLLLVI